MLGGSSAYVVSVRQETERSRMPNGRKKIVVMAPHDDGFGAFSILARLACALKENNSELRFVFVSGTRGNKSLEEFGLSDVARIVQWDNLITLPKDPDAGGVDVTKLAKDLSQKLPQADAWLNLRSKLNWEDVELAISMGVPWLHGVASEVRVPSVEVGDMCWSIVLRKILESGTCLTPALEALLHSVASYEHKATEAWLLPFAAPNDYVAHFSESAVPVNWIPGVFGTQDPSELPHQQTIKGLLQAQLSRRAHVGIHSGFTPVWEKVMDELRGLPSGSTGDPAFTTLNNATKQIEILEQGGGTFPAPPISSLIPLHATQDLGITRGGITVLDHIAARCPLAITEEPHHWLSDRQRNAALAAGVCLPLDLDAFRTDPRQLTAGLLAQTSKLRNIKQQMAAVPIGAAAPLAEYLVKRFL